MPLDKDQLKRVSNLLNTLQVRTALESTNISPQYLSNETARRDAQELENARNKIDPVTKKPYKYSEKWLQSTGQPIPGLDDEGTSTIEALNVIQTGQLAKLLGQIGKQGVKKVLKDLVLKETVGGSPVKLPKPSGEVELYNNLPFSLRRDNIGELMNLGTKSDGAYYNRQLPISVSEQLGRVFEVPIRVPEPTRIVREYLPLPTKPGFNIPIHIRQLMAKRQAGTHTGFGKLNDADWHKMTQLERQLTNNAQHNRFRREMNQAKDALQIQRFKEVMNKGTYKNSDGMIDTDLWNEGFRIVDRPTQNKLPYFSKIADDINKGLAERLAGKDVQ